MLRLLTALLIALVALPVGAQDVTTTAPTGSGQTQMVIPVLAPEFFRRATLALDALQRQTGTNAGADDLDQVLRDLTTTIYLNPTFSEAYYARALVYVGLRDFDQADADLERAIAFLPPDDPDYAGSLYEFRAELLRELGRADEALAIYNDAIAAAPSAELYAGRALLYYRDGEYADALEDLDAAIALGGASPALYFYRATTHDELDRPTSAQRAAEDYYAYVEAMQTSSTAGGRLTAAEPELVQMTEGAVFTFTLSGKADDIWTIRAEARPGDAVDPLLIVLDPDGNPIAADDDSGARAAGGLDAQITRLTLPSDGTYTIVVSHSLGGSEGLIAIGAIIQAE